jgi:transcriptional regulator with XRE-family HTH domain
MNQAHTTQEPDDNAARIRRLRVDLGLTQREIARVLGQGWSQGRISSYECRLLPFSAAMEQRIIAAIERAYAAKAAER